METLDAAREEASPQASTGPVPVVEMAAWSEDEWRAHTTWALVTTLSMVAMLSLLRFMPSVGWPLVAGAIGAYLCHPSVTSLSRRGLGRTGATAALFLLLGVVFLVAMVMIVPVLADQVARVPVYLEAALVAVGPTVRRFAGREMPASLSDLTALAEDHLQEIVTNVLPTAGSVLGIVVGGSLSALSFLLGAIVAPIVGFYLLKDWPGILARFDALIPPRQRPVVRRRMSDVDRKLGGFVRGQLTMATVLAALYSVALTLMGLKLAVVVGLVTGFGNLIPYVGTALGVTLASAFCIVDFGVDHHLMVVWATYVGLVTADSVFITPRIVGDKVGLSPAAVMISVLACGSLFGFGGVLLGVPCAAVLKDVITVSVQAYRQSRLYREG